MLETVISNTKLNTKVFQPCFLSFKSMYISFNYQHQIELQNLWRIVIDKGL